MSLLPNNKVLKKEYSTMSKIQNDNNIIKVSGEVVRLCEFIKDKLYFATIANMKDPSSSPAAHFFCIDDEFVYINYYNDFGPLNLAHLYRYCVKLRAKLNCPSLSKIIHYTTPNPHKRANAAFLIASFAIIFLHRTPKEAYRTLLSENGVPFKPFQDASIGNSSYQLRLLECLEGLHRAIQCGFFRFSDFCVEEFELYSKMDHGDINWIIPQKFLAFCGPISNPGPTNHRRPEDYFDYFLQNNVGVVIRLSKREYDAHSTFEMVGIKHYDLYYMDGGIPSLNILNKFMSICEDATGAIAVHCKAGLGRTGSLIGAYMIKHYRMKAKEVIAWMRICRPGSVIGKQQAWLEDLEEDLWAAGDIYRYSGDEITREEVRERRKRHGDGDRLPFHKYGIYSIAEKMSRSRGIPRPKSPKAELLVTPRNRAPLRQKHVEPAIVKDGVASKSAYPCHPVKGAGPAQVASSRPRKIPVLYDAHSSAIAPNFVSSGAGTSGQTGVRTPSTGAMRHVNPHQLRSKKLAYVTGKLMASNNPKPKLQEEDTQGDKLRRAKYFKEASCNYVNKAPLKR